MVRVPDSRGSRRVSASALVLAAALGASAALVAAPRAATRPLRDAWLDVLRPGQIVVASILERSAFAWSRWSSVDGAELAKIRKQTAELHREVERLQVQLRLAQLENTMDHDQELPPLLVPHVVPARVLGRQAKAYLASREIVSVGRDLGAAPESLVLSDPAGPAILDQGKRAEIEKGRMVLAGRTVFGKVAEVGAHTSTVVRVTDRGFRELVQLATPDKNGRLRFATRGILVGQGEALCKIEMVDVSHRVTVGDSVLTLPDGFLDLPLHYGRIVRVKRMPGSAHWDIWMEPAVARNAVPERVSVLRPELNPSRQ